MSFLIAYAEKTVTFYSIWEFPVLPDGSLAKRGTFYLKSEIPALFFASSFFKYRNCPPQSTTSSSLSVRSNFVLKVKPFVTSLTTTLLVGIWSRKFSISSSSLRSIQTPLPTPSKYINTEPAGKYFPLLPVLHLWIWCFRDPSIFSFLLNYAKS